VAVDIARMDSIKKQILQKRSINGFSTTEI